MKTQWDLSPLKRWKDQKGLENIRKEVEQKTSTFIHKWKKRDDYLTDPTILKEALDEYEAWAHNIGAYGNEWYYYNLALELDQNNPQLKAGFTTIQQLSTKLINDLQFFTLNLAKVPLSVQKKLVSSSLLAPYTHFLERLFAEAKYLLSEKEERILNLKAITSYSQWVHMVSGFLAKEERDIVNEKNQKTKKNFSEIISLINSSHKKVRDSAAEAFNDIMEKHSDSAEAELNAILLHKKTDDELRGVIRPDLTRHLADDVSSDMVDTLLASVKKRFSISNRYYELKTKVLGVKKIAYHERSVELTVKEKKYPFDKAVDIVLTTFKNLDSDFYTIFSSFLEHGQIDVFSKKGKRNGAFCSHNLLSQPTYILLNHTDKLNDVLTLAHELGHGINNELIRKKHNAINFETPTSTAEVASTFMEDFVLRELVKDMDDEDRFYIQMTKLNDDVSSIFRQVACYMFEQELHLEFRKKNFLSKQEIGALFQKHMSAYMGSFVEQSAGSENWWVYWSHIRYFFYVYSYAGGLLISKSLQSSVRQDPAFIEKVKVFLSAGLSDSPKNIFAKLGIDITSQKFWHNGLDEIETLLDETWKLGEKLGKIS